MPISEENALDILAELIKKPESKAEEIPRIWGEIIALYNQQFAPPVEEPKKKKRRRGPANPNIGWPAGVKREEYGAWKAEQTAKGRSEGLNPQEFKRQRDAGLWAPSAKAADAPPAAKATVAAKAEPAKKKPAPKSK